MSEVGVSETASTRAFCGSCGGAITAQDTFCAQCGRQVATDDDPTAAMGDPSPATAATTQNANGTAAGIAYGAPTNGAPVPGAAPPPPPGGYPHPGYTGVPPQGPPAAYPSGAYPVPVPPQRTNTGLIVGLIAAGIAAVGLIVAVVLLATSNHGTTPTVTATSAAAPITAVAPSAGSALASSGSTNAGKLKSTTPKPVPTTSTPTPAPTTSTPTPVPTGNAADVQAANQVVVEQWNLIGSGDFSAAAQKWSPAMGGDWISSHQQEAPITVANLSVGTPTMNSSTDATVPLNSLTTTASDGCMNWSGSYDVINVGGQWLMHSANINGTKC